MHIKILETYTKLDNNPESKEAFQEVTATASGYWRRYKGSR